MRKILKGKFPGIDKKAKAKRWSMFINTLTIVLFGGAVTWMIAIIYFQEKENHDADERYKASLQKSGEAVQHNLVCMVNNMYMGSQQIAVPIDEKTYYGCCQKCVKDLTTDESTRFALDPFSKKTVDKAMAFITIHPNKTGVVLYFESQQNAKKYLEE
jgi:YHS domain-containing protein